MQDTILKSGWDTLLFAVPSLGMLLIGLFRLDELFAAPKQRLTMRRPASGIDENGRLLMTDPDGRPWRDSPIRR